MDREGDAVSRVVGRAMVASRSIDIKRESRLMIVDR